MIKTNKIFGIGLNKTGTKTLGRCIEIFGYSHLSYDLELLKAFARRDYKSIYLVSDKYDGFEDWPWPLLYKEFDRKYPEAKFILTVRKDPEKWFFSLCKHAERTGPTEARKIVYGHSMPHEFKDHHINIYTTHNNEVMGYFADRLNKLLIVCWEDGDGWNELCPFLNVPFPNLDFPHINKTY